MNPLRSLKFDWRRLISRLAQFVRLVMGEFNFNYNPPVWCKALAERIARTSIGRWSKLQIEKAKSNPKLAMRISGAFAIAVVALVVGYFQLMKYLDSRPKPDYVTYETSVPAEPDLETQKISPLTVTFSKSAARIEDLNHALKSPPSLSPEIKGTWHWVTDAKLLFVPEENWRIGTKYELALNRKLFPATVLLQDMTSSFATPELKGEIIKQEFYQDPRDPNIKRALLNIRYNYPLNTEDFKKRIAVTLQTKDDATVKERPQNISFTTSFGKYLNEAYVLSDVIAIPKENSVAHIEIADGAQASRGGKAKDKIVASIDVPGRFEYFKFTGTEATFARNDKFEPEQVLVIKSKAELPTEVLAKSLKLWLLPKKNQKRMRATKNKRNFRPGAHLPR